MEKIEIKDLVVSVDENLILKGVNLTINKGEIHALIGPNGHGKSTLLMAMMGHPSYEIQSGKILFNGEDITEMSPDERSRKGLFLAMQAPLEINGVTNMDFFKSIINAHRDDPINFFEFVKKVEQNSLEVGFNLDLASRYLNEGFSGGEKKRNELLQLKLLQPKLALLDEIDSGLDIDGLTMVADSLLQLQSEHLSALIVSHYIDLYKKVKPTKVHLIIDGKIALTGDFSLLEKVNKQGYSWLEKEMNISIKKETDNRPSSSGLCLDKVV